MDGDRRNSGKERGQPGPFSSRSGRDQALTRLLRRTDAVTTDQLHQLGISRKIARNLVAHGDLVRVHPGVYLDGRSIPTPWVRLKAALLAAGPGAFLSHRSAAGARRYRPINPREIHVSVVADHTPKIPGLTIHRTTAPARGEVTVTGGLRVASLPRILIELAQSATDSELTDLITQGERRDALGDIAEALERHARRPGIRRLRQHLAHHISSPAYNSTLEQRVWAWYGTQPDLPPPDETNIHLGPHEFDGLWHEARVGLEIDSRTYHQARADIENDRRKDIYVQKLGLRVIRVTDTRFDLDRSGVRADLLAFLTAEA